MARKQPICRKVLITLCILATWTIVPAIGFVGLFADMLDRQLKRMEKER